MSLSDMFRDGMEQQDWKTRNAARLREHLTLEADVVVVGSGAGGATTADVLSRGGLHVVVIEEGPLRTRGDFNLHEADAYAELYQEGGGRVSKDNAITILQGRAVGGTTLVNWTSSFRTPDETLHHWSEAHEVAGHSPEEMAPWFERVEERLGIKPWDMVPNANNAIIRDGCEALGWSWGTIARNVRHCANLGYCGVGCPLDAKQSMLVTMLPDVLERGGELLYLARAERLLREGDRVTGVECLALDERGNAPTGHRITVRARHVVLSGGSINTPGILLRSEVPDPNGRVGKRTFIHVANFSAAQLDETVNPFHGAPQSVYSDAFLWDDGVTGNMSFKLEANPLLPTSAAALLGGFGKEHAERMAELPHTSMMLALMRDGFHPDSAEGTVELRDDGSPVLDYRMNRHTWDGVRRAYHRMAEIQFAGGARAVMPLHADAGYVKSLAQARSLIDGLDLAPYRARLASAHVMGGCAMSEDPALGVTDSLGRHHHLDNLSIHDGSLFPTSIGANPQLTVYALTAKLAEDLAERLAEKPT